ncbi:nucleotidyltransferase domain-containing protein [Sphingobacterium faecale]|uniref:Nucleotidyltransferase family protein n=1 Tax=Sphingobacterium faecale TaxID=2803775 RepID=A0ABS1QXX3_9SPHI|nr:nucleotidyltransferase family protein [Sphingobacterium faecale]MBL1407278.1 nucleotidyltransferase family protein [Sphingobacterium faecale]
MERVYTVFFSLLQSGLWSKPIASTDKLPLSPAEWQSLYELSKAQTVEGLVFDAIEQLDVRLLPPTDLWMKWLVRVTKIEQHNRIMNQGLGEQIVIFERLGVEPVLLKGQGVAVHYNAPLRRTCGDIDWYFSTKEQYEKANDWVIQQGGDIKYVPGRSMCYHYKGLEIDHHSNLIDLYNPFVKPFLQKLIAVERAKDESIDIMGHICRTLSPLLNIIQVVSHVLKHLLSFGLGLRQLCDVARLYYVHRKEIEGTYLRDIYRQLGIERWVVLMHDLLVRYLGLERHFLPYPINGNEKADWMMEDILRAGNFGFFDKQYSDEVRTGERKNAFLRVSRNLWKYGRYVPIESFFFPLVQVYTRVLSR